MSGTKIGGMKAAMTNKAIRGEDFYKKIGMKGGKNGHTGGFYNNPALARVAGAKGGRASKRNSPYVAKLTENHDRIKILYEQGLISIRDIANIMGVPYNTMLHYIRTRFGEKK
jgi:hypothetical protein